MVTVVLAAIFMFAGCQKAMKTDDPQLKPIQADAGGTIAAGNDGGESKRVSFREGLPVRAGRESKTRLSPQSATSIRRGFSL